MKVYILRNVRNNTDRTNVINAIKEGGEHFSIFCLGNYNLNVTQWICGIMRNLGVISSKPKIRAIIPVESQQHVIQLCLAKKNKMKFGEYEAAASGVIDCWKQLWCASEITEDLNTFKKSYGDFLQNSSVIDHADLLKMLESQMNSDNTLLTELLSKISVVLEDPDEFSTIDKKLLQVVCSKASFYETTISSSENSLDISGIEPTDDKLSQNTNDRELDNIAFKESSGNHLDIFKITDTYGCISNTSPAPLKANHYIEQLFHNFLRLLLNTKDELALAVLLNMPGRNINQKDFNQIKAVADNKNMPIYQTIMSTTMRLQLGGKGYQPDSKCPLVIHCKPLTEFVDFMMQLQSVIEEESDEKKSCVKIISLIKANLKKLDGNPLSNSKVDGVAKDLHAHLEYLWNIDLFKNEVIPEQEEAASCSSQTLTVSKQMKKSLKYLLCLCDRAAGSNTNFLVSNLTSNQIISRATPKSNGKTKTPVCIPSIVNLYSSPAVEPTDDSAMTSLKERISKSKDMTPVQKNKKFKSHCAWAVSNSPITNLPSPSSVSPIIGPTLVAVAPRAKRPHDWKQIVDEIREPDEVQDSCEPTPAKKTKRSLLKDIVNVKPNKKPVPKKKKITSVPSGQMSIKSFFTSAPKNT